LPANELGATEERARALGGDFVAFFVTFLAFFRADKLSFFRAGATKLHRREKNR
jgi:hypothetical protein